MFTKKHFEAIAHTLDANVADGNLVADFADMLEDSNPRFDRVLFTQAATRRLRQRLTSELRMLDKEATP